MQLVQFKLEVMPEFTGIFPTIDNFLDRKWFFLSEIWVDDKSASSPLLLFDQNIY